MNIGRIRREKYKMDVIKDRRSMGPRTSGTDDAPISGGIQWRRNHRLHRGCPPRVPPNARVLSWRDAERKLGLAAQETPSLRPCDSLPRRQTKICRGSVSVGLPISSCLRFWPIHIPQ